MQNIPSHNREIRMLFCAKPGYKIIGGDFSAQEPRLTSFYAQDPAMLGAYAEGKDLYAVIASMSFDKPYEDCLEFYPEGTVIQYEGKTVTCGHKTHQNKDGKGRRTQAKSILLGLLYGRGAKSVGEQINKTTEEAQEEIIPEDDEAESEVPATIVEEEEVTEQTALGAAPAEVEESTPAAATEEIAKTGDAAFSAMAAVTVLAGAAFVATKKHN